MDTKDIDRPLTDAASTGPRSDPIRRAALGRSTAVLMAVAAVVLVAGLSIALGARTVPFGEIVTAFTAFDPSNADHLVIRSLRLPRTLLGLMVGAALGVAGAAMQGVTRNPLADPGILGVNAGAALAVVLGIHVVGIGSALGYVLFAFAGAAIVSVFVYLLGSLGRDGATPVKLALAGAATAGLLASITTTVLLLDTAALDEFRFWVVGSIAGRDWDVIGAVAPFLVVGAVLSAGLGPILNTLALGDDIARSLGQRVGLARLIAAVAIVLLVGAATAAAGPIAFVGLTVPHVARSLVGPDYRWIVPLSAAFGATLLVGADVVGRMVARPAEVQVGVITAFVGAPVFISLVRRRRVSAL